MLSILPCHHVSALALPLLALASQCRGALGLRKNQFVVVDLVAVTDTQQPSWVAPVLARLPDARLQLYCTGQLPVDAPCIRMEPRGSEEYALLKHIVAHYHELTPVTVLTSRDLGRDAEKQRRLENIVQQLSSTGKQRRFPAFLSENIFKIRPVWDGPKETCGPSLRPFGDWYKKFVNATDSSWSRIGCTAAALGNVFAVRREQIHRFPLAVYQGLLREVEHCQDQHSKVIGYYIERSWAAMFAHECHSPQAGGPIKLGAKGAQAVGTSVLTAAKAHVQPAAQTQALAQEVRKEQPKKSLDLVVASYNAPLDWIDAQLKKLPGARLFLYCKGDSTDPRCIRIDNVGTEEYAFIVHMLRHWNDMADITVFTKDNMVDYGFYYPTASETLNFITNQLADTQFRNQFSGFLAKTWFPLGPDFDVFKYHKSTQDAQVKLLCRPSVSPYGKWYTRFINPDDSNFTRMNCVTASMHGIFGVSRDRIHSVPRSRFVEILREVENCRGENAFTGGHYMERSWSMLFAERCHREEAIANLERTKAHLPAFYSRFQTVSEP